MQQVILTIILFFSSLMLVQAQESQEKYKERTVTVTVVNALNDGGAVRFAFFNKEGFRKQSLFAKSASIEKGISKVTFTNVPQGEYAVVCFHDENNNGQLDFHENGIPKESYGAVELIARYGNVDLNDGKVQGGQFRKWMFGVNWWMDQHWKTSISYGDVTLDRFDTHGRTKMLLLRLQWLNI